MPVRVKVDGYGVVEFPDGMSGAEMSGILQHALARANAPRRWNRLAAASDAGSLGRAEGSARGWKRRRAARRLGEAIRADIDRAGLVQEMEAIGAEQRRDRARAEPALRTNSVRRGTRQQVAV